MKKKNNYFVLIGLCIIVGGCLLVFFGIKEKTFSASDVKAAFGQGWDDASVAVFEKVGDDGIITYEDGNVLLLESTSYTDAVGNGFGLDSLQDKEYEKSHMNESYQNGFNNAVVYIFSAAKSGVLYDVKRNEYRATDFVPEKDKNFDLD